MSHHCIICGLPIGGTRLPPWSHKFRALYTVHHGWNKARLSRVQTWTQETKYYIRYEPEMKEFDLKGGLIPFFRSCLPFKEMPQECDSAIVWGFQFHEACYEIFSTNCRDNGVKNYEQALSDVLRSFPAEDGLVDWAHLISNSNAIPLRNFLMNIMAIYWGTPSDPLRLPDLTASMSDSETNYPPRSHYLWGPFRRSKTMPSNGEDPFSKFPAELLHEILMHLNSLDARSLKISSPICDSVVLSSQFWRSRFWPGRDFPYYFDADDRALSLERWRNLWFVVRKLDGARCLRERKQIYKQSDKLRKLIMQRISTPVCYGTPVKSFSEPEAEKPGREWFKASAKLCKPKDWFKTGARALWKRDAPIPPSFISIHVSWVIINGKKYISGIRIDQDGTLETKLGYVRSSQETLIGWKGYGDHSGQEDVVGFDLAIDESGIRGLAVLSSSKGISRWVGDSLDIPKSRLLLTDNRILQPPVKNIRAKFDALKMVSLAISSGVPDVACAPK